MLRDVICNYQSINQSINLLLYGRSNAGLHELVTVAYLHHVLLNICSVDYFHALQNTHTHTHARTHARTHTHPFNGPLSGTTRVSRYQKSKTNLDFTEARDSEWQWHQLGHMQVCTSLQTDNHASTPPFRFFTGRMPFLPPNQQRQSTEGSPTEYKKYKYPQVPLIFVAIILVPGNYRYHTTHLTNRLFRLP